MKRAIVIALSVILALVVAAPIAAGQQTSADKQTGKQDLADLTAASWNWAFSTNPSPLEGSYEGGTQCEGEYVDGVFFLAAAPLDSGSVKRTCTVPADTPILFAVVDVICSEAWPTDPTLYDECAMYYTDLTVERPSKWYATLDGEDLEMQRVASGLFQWTIASDNNPYGLPAGTYEAGSDGLWVYLKHGLKPGEHTIVFGGTFKNTPFGNSEGAQVTYKLTAV